VATARSSDPSISSTQPDDLDAGARSGRIYTSTDKVEGLVRDNRVEVRVSSAHEKALLSGAFALSSKECRTARPARGNFRRNIRSRR